METTKKESFFGELLRFTLLALLIVLPIRWFIAQPFIVEGASMEPTFHSNEYLIVDQLTYRFEEPARGDVIIFKYPKEPSKYFIKRIIGLPGETVSVDGARVTITDSEGKAITLEEPYINAMHGGAETQTLKDDEYFVMGDNRDASSDSRAWGVLPRKNIIGRAYVRLFPVTEIGILPGEYRE